MRKLILLLSTVFCTLVHSQPLEIVVPFSAGGATDIVAREIQKSLTNKIAPNIIVVNKPGADGVVAGEYFFSNQSNKIFMATTGSSLFAKLNNQSLPYDPLSDFDIIGPLVTTASVVAVRSDSAIKDFDSLIAQSKKKPVACGTSNSMAVSFAKYLIATQEINMIIVPYKGTSPMMVDLEGKHIDCAIDALPGFVGKPVTPILISAPDYTKTFNAPVIVDYRYRFENFFTVAIGRTVDPKLKQQIVNEIVALSKNPEFIKSMAVKGYHVTRDFDLDYTSKLRRDYTFLKSFQSKLD